MRTSSTPRALLSFARRPGRYASPGRRGCRTSGELQQAPVLGGASNHGWRRSRSSSRLPREPQSFDAESGPDLVELGPRSGARQPSHRTVSIRAERGALMSQQERWQLSGKAAEFYERYVSLRTDPWVHGLIEVAALQAGERVLDL